MFLLLLVFSFLICLSSPQDGCKKEGTEQAENYGELMKTFGPERDEATGEWKSLHNEEFYYLYFSPYITCLIKSRTMLSNWHVARI